MKRRGRARCFAARLRWPRAGGRRQHQGRAGFTGSAASRTGSPAAPPPHLAPVGRAPARLGIAAPSPSLACATPRAFGPPACGQPRSGPAGSGPGPGPSSQLPGPRRGPPGASRSTAACLPALCGHSWRPADWMNFFSVKSRFKGTSPDTFTAPCGQELHGSIAHWVKSVFVFRKAACGANLVV